MAVKLTQTTENEFNAVDLETGEEINCKNWFEKSKDKWHVVLGPNSANRKYVAHNEIKSKLVDGVYIVEDKTSGPRVLGTARPDTKLIPFMTEEDKVRHEEIIAAAIKNRDAERTEEEKLEAEIKRLQAKLAGETVPRVSSNPIDYIIDAEEYTAIIERAAEAKANAPKAPRAPRGPLTTEQKIAKDEKALTKLQAKLEAMRAANI